MSAGDERGRSVLRVEGAGDAIRGEVQVPGHKSVAHRAALFAALAPGRSVIDAYPEGADTLTSLALVEALGARVQRRDGGRVVVVAPDELRAPTEPLHCGNSGTSARLLAGLLAGRGLAAELRGDASLSRRPMERVARPLRALGARVEALGEGGTMPLSVKPAPLRGAEVRLEVASAQLKSALLLAGLGATGSTTILEPGRSRDHSERMLRLMGADLSFRPGFAKIVGPCPTLRPLSARVPGDPSSAAFLAVLATLREGSELALPGVLCNPTRDVFVSVLRRMGADLSWKRQRVEGAEPVADLMVKGAALRATDVAAGEVPGCLDELPVLAVAMACAEGTSRISGARELRVKESDRIAGTAAGLRAFGAEVEEHEDGWSVHGPARLVGARPDPLSDHRLVMAFAVAAAVAEGSSEVPGADWADVSYPGFVSDLSRLGVAVSRQAGQAFRGEAPLRGAFRKRNA